MTKKYGIFNKRNLEVEVGESTKKSRYLLGYSEGAPFKKFTTRSEARTFKKTLKHPQRYAIVNIPEFAVVR